MSTAVKKSGFVNPMTLRQELAEQTGAQPLAIEPAVPQAAEEVKAAGLPEKKGKAATEPRPWDNCHPKVKIHFGLRMSERLHKQFEYAAAHTLGDSMQTFALRALDEAVHKRLKELGVI